MALKLTLPIGDTTPESCSERPEQHLRMVVDGRIQRSRIVRPQRHDRIGHAPIPDPLALNEWALMLLGDTTPAECTFTNHVGAVLARNRAKANLHYFRAQDLSARGLN